MTHLPGQRLLLIAALLLGRATGEASEPVDYLRDVKPVLKRRCYACHGGLKQESGLRLDTGVAIRRGGDSGAAVTPQRAGNSLLMQRISATDALERMPPEGEPLSADQIQAIRAWIEAGADSPENERPQSDPRTHWAFRRVERPAVPPGGQGNNAIDAFIERRLTEHGLTPRPPQRRDLLLRRTYLDLIGLPPTSIELQAFLDDDSPDAFERVVDRLLDSPQYGERWGRHWMDVWRYSDWYGRRHVPDVWNSASQIWRWRDWIVSSLNADRGYDRMVQEMLAGDEIAPEDDRAGYATGYLVRNWYALNPNDWMRNTVEHTGKAFLGLTFNCAHCHDHKYDPIRQEDYFRLRAFFEPIDVRQDRVPGEADPGPFQQYEYSTLRKIQRLGAVRIYDRDPDAATWFYTGGDERNRVTERGSIAPGVPAFLSGFMPEIEPIDLPATAWYPGLRRGIQETILSDARAEVSAAERELAAAERTAAEPPAELRRELACAEAEYDRVRKAEEPEGQSGALSGRQSLVLDATGGRKIVQNPVKQLAAFVDGATLEFDLLILRDSHVNFQYAKDTVKGLTAAYVGFNQGRIVSYRPGSFTEFDVGKYSFDGGQRRFHVRLVAQTSTDQCRLTIRSLGDGRLLVDDVPVALNGWKPGEDPTKAISFDARPGSVALIDDVSLTSPIGTGSNELSRVRFDFEPPAYSDGQDVVGIEGWVGSKFADGNADTALVSSTAANNVLRDAANRVDAATQAVERYTLPLRAAAANLIAARDKLRSVEATIAADVARFGDDPYDDASSRIREASHRERTATVSKAQANVLAQELALVTLEAESDGDAKRPGKITAAQKQLAVARNALIAAQTAAADESNADAYTSLSPKYPRTSTGRRRALAIWMTHRDNPLTARVAVNHIWMRHFHKPLVDTVFDFGLNGSGPTHPELLDWLAAELMESGWSMKHLHRLIVTSAAWRRSSAANGADAALAADPDNNLLWRMNTGRMEAEVIRDSLLYCGGQLDLTMGGQELENNESLTTRRRSMYYATFPEEGGKGPLDELFDGPDALECYRRSRTIVPQQALVLTNSELVHEISTAIASEGAVGSDEGFVDAMFMRILSRPATDAERALCVQLLAEDGALSPEPGVDGGKIRTRAGLVRVLFNHNDFQTIR